MIAQSGKLQTDAMAKNTSGRPGQYKSQPLNDTAATVNFYVKDTTADTSRFITDTRPGGITIDPQPIGQKQEGFELITGSLIVAMMLFLLIKLTRKNFFKNLEAGIISRALFRQMLRDDTLFPPGTRAPLFFSAITVFSVFAFQIIRNFKLYLPFGNDGIYMQFVLLMALILGFLVVKNLLISVTGSLFKTQSVSRQYKANNLFFNTLTALSLIPLMLISYFDKGNTILLATIAILSIIFIFRVVRGLLIALRVEKYSLYQIFLYLCALEILPIVVIIKLIISHNGD